MDPTPLALLPTLLALALTPLDLLQILRASAKEGQSLGLTCRALDMASNRSDLRNNLTDHKLRTSSHPPDNPSETLLPLLPQEVNLLSVGQLPTVASRHHSVHLLPMEASRHFMEDLLPMEASRHFMEDLLPMEAKLLTAHQLLRMEVKPSTVTRHPTAAKFPILDPPLTQAASLPTPDLTAVDGELTKCDSSAGKSFVHYLRVYPTFIQSSLMCIYVRLFSDQFHPWGFGVLGFWGFVTV